jgi:sigma-B regulation protein RsbQ
MDLIQRNHISLSGRGTSPMIFAHGFGCDQNMWRFVAPAFADQHKIVLYDHVGAGKSDLSAYSFTKYDSLQGYADDLLEICSELNLRNAIFVGHSVSSVIGILAAINAPEYFRHLILIGPSPRYINDDDYTGGFDEHDIAGLLDMLDANYLNWSNTMAPVIMGNPGRPELGIELSNSFCQTDPEIARHFARVTFTSDNRDDLPKVTTPSLILQCSEDVIAPEAVGRYVHKHIHDSQLAFMKATGHCPNLSAPDETISLIKAYLEQQVAQNKDASHAY